VNRFTVIRRYPAHEMGVQVEKTGLVIKTGMDGN
jgi:hypothetical protein